MCYNLILIFYQFYCLISKLKYDICSVFETGQRPQMFTDTERYTHNAQRVQRSALFVKVLRNALPLPIWDVSSSLTYSLVVVSSRPQGEKLTRKVGRPTKQGTISAAKLSKGFA